MARTFISHRLSIRHRIFGGFGLLIAVFLVAVAISLRGLAHVDQEADASYSSSLVAEHVADFVSKAVEAQKSVLRYAVSENDADLVAARKALSEFAEGARVLKETSAGWKSGVSAVSSAVEAESKYQAASADTIQTIAGRRTATSQFNKEITALRTIGSAIPAALLRENAAPETVTTAIRLLEAVQVASAAASRFLASRNPADAAAAQTELDALQAAIESLQGSTANSKRVQRFLAAAAEPLEHTKEALNLLISTNEGFIRLSAERKAVGDTLQSRLKQIREISESERKGALASMRDISSASWRLGLAASALSLCLGALLAWLIGSSIITALGRISMSVCQLAGGNLSVEIPHRGEHTELGIMADGLQVLKDALIAFEEKAFALTKHLSDASEQMQWTANSMSTTAEQTASQIVTVENAAGQTSASVRQVAAVTAELSNSIREIASEVKESTRIVDRIVTNAEQTSNIVKTLGFRRQPDWGYRRAHQQCGETNRPARIERHHRGRARRRGWQGLRRCGGRGQGIGWANHKGDGANYRPNLRNPGRHRESGKRNSGNFPENFRNVRHLQQCDDLHRRAGRGNPEDCAKRSGRGGRHNPVQRPCQRGASDRRRNGNSRIQGARGGAGTGPAFRQPWECR